MLGQIEFVYFFNLEVKKKRLMSVKFKKLDPAAIVPNRATKYSAGFDLYALEDIVIERGSTTKIRTGIAVQLPPGTYGRIAMRSGLGLNQGLAVTGGVIDLDYADEIGVLVYRIHSGSYIVLAGAKIAQLIVEQCYYGPAEEVAEFGSERETGHVGFGSTGL